MKIKINSIFFISLLVFSAYTAVASEPEGTGVFALSVDGDREIKGLAQDISRAIEKELGGIKERMGRGAREELIKYDKFEKEIVVALDEIITALRDPEVKLYDPTLKSNVAALAGDLKNIAQRNFPEIYPRHMDKPEVKNRHFALGQIFKLGKFVPGKKTKDKLVAFKATAIRNLSRTKDHFSTFTKDLSAAGSIPTKNLHITLCECGARGCNKRGLKRLFSKFYDTKTRYVEFSIEEIAVYDDGPGWVALKIKSSYLNKLIKRLKKDPSFGCNVRTPFHAHISILKFDGFGKGLRNIMLQSIREFLGRAGPALLRDFGKRYCTDIKEFGIKKVDFKYL